MLVQHHASTATSRAQLMADALVTLRACVQDLNNLLFLWFGA